MLDKVFNKLVYLFFLTFPAYILGINIGGYPVNIPTVILLFLGVMIFLRNRYVKITMYAYIFLILWFFLSSILQLKLVDFSLSLLFFVIVTYPMVAAIPDSFSVKKLSKYLLGGFYISLLFCLVVIVSNYYGFDVQGSMELGSPPAYLWMDGVKELPRLKSLMLEPSYYAVYLTFIFVFIDRHQLMIRKYNLHKLFVLIALLFTFSLSGYMLFLSYFLLSYVFRRRIPRKWVFYGVFFLVGLSFIYVSNKKVHSVVDRVLVTRLNNISRNVDEDNSESVRKASLIIFPKYMETSSFLKLLVGEGFSNTEAWSKEHTGNGLIYMVLPIVFLSSGIIGFLIFMGFLFLFFIEIKQPISVLVVPILFLFVTGHFILYYVWGLFFLLRVFKLKNDDND